MILPDNTPESPTKSRAGPLSAVSEEAHEDQIPPPPAYPGHTSYQYQNVDLEAQAGTSRAPLIQRPVYSPAEHGEQFEPAPKRFLKAFGVALLIYIAVASFTRTAVAGVHWETGGRHIQIPLPRSSDGKVISCSSASRGHLSISRKSTGPVTTFHVPQSADLLSIWGRGALSHGNINFLSTTDPSIPRDSVRVDIIPHDYSTEALQSTNICLLEPAANRKSIAILTPTSWRPADDLAFTVDVYFPISISNLTPLRVNAFETNLPLFTHTFSKLEGKVVFESLKVYSANKPIYGDYIDAKTATIVTSNARIDGKFHVSRSLELRTSNQLIDAEVTLEYDGPTLALGDTSTNLTMYTTNALVHSKVSLLTTSPVGLGGSFAVSASTENGAVDLSFPAQPADSTLTLSAHASNAPATVHLHPAFEGWFTAGAANGHVTLSVDEHATDPAYKGRSRVWVLSERTMKAWRGFASWGARNDSGRDLKGAVSVETVNGVVELRM